MAMYKPMILKLAEWLMEMSEFWFEYKVDDDGNATSTPLDWSHIIESDAS